MMQPDTKSGAGGLNASTVFQDRRRSPRQAFDPPRVAALRLGNGNGTQGRTGVPEDPPFYLEACDYSAGGLLLRTTRSLAVGQRFQLFIFRHPGQSWGGFECQTRWVQPDRKRAEYHLVGCHAVAAELAWPWPAAAHDQGRPFPADYEFFRKVPFLKAIHRDAVCPLLNHIRHRSVKAGQRFISQGDEGDICYIVQAGTCRAILEKHGKCHPVGVIKEGEFVGEMALLTGEPRSAHVEALTDLELWGIPWDMLEALLQVNPEVGTFLTEIVAERFASRKLTADRRIGKYLITDILGRGAFAIVYNGYHADLNRRVAIKMLRHDMAMNPEFLGNFRKEARMIASLNHENIVKVFDIEERFRTIFIIMERLEGQTLRDRLDEVGGLSPAEALNVAIQVCRGLAYAHERLIVHQDIKPSNIFRLPDGKVKVLDFGLACPCGSENLLTGTPDYMSPEQIECLPVDERADIFALGLTLFEMLSGRRPFEESDAFKRMALHVETDIPDPAGFAPGLPGPLREVVLKACARDPETRFRNAGQMLAVLESIREKIGLDPERSVLPKRKLSTLMLMYREDQQIPLSRLMEEFSDKAQQLGVILRAADFKDI